MKNFNDELALQFVLTFIDTKDLLQAAMNGFSIENNQTSIENSDICYKAIQAYLK
jgi:S-adenosylhomocysteine hydrolase